MTAMDHPVELLIHLDATVDGPVWWAESPDLPGFTAAAPTLAELRDRCWDVLVTERLIG